MFVNLSQRVQRTALQKFMHRSELDYYLASSLSAMIEGFFEKPPQKKCNILKNPSAYVLLDNLKYKEIEPDFFTEECALKNKHIPLHELIDSYEALLRFKIKDLSREVVGFWSAGSSHEYLHKKLEFGFGNEQFTNIPKSILQYTLLDKKVFLHIKIMQNNYYIQADSDSANDSLEELIPQFM